MANCYPEIGAGRRAALVAVASRSFARADSLAHRLGVPRAYGSYRTLLADPDIDVVYNALPNHLHVTWSLRALEAGKHVLCEKPLSISVSEAMRLVEAARRSDRFLFEGYMWRHHPQWDAVRSFLAEGVIGRPLYAHMHYGYRNVDPESARNKRSTGGGALLMIGCYPVGMFVEVFGGWPTAVSSVRRVDSALGVDVLTQFTMAGEGVSMTATVSSQLWPQQRLSVFGDAGSIELSAPVTPGKAEIPTMVIDQGGPTRRVELPVGNQFALQADAVGQAIEEDRRPDLTFGLRVLSVLDAVRASGSRGGEAVAATYPPDA